MTLFEKKIEEFKSRGYEVTVEDLGYCKEATASGTRKEWSKDPFGNETSSEPADVMTQYTITEYDDGTVEVVKEY